MFKSLLVAGMTALAGIASVATASATTIDVMVLQEDWDKQSVERDTRIQRGVLIEFAKTLNSPSFKNYMLRYGLEGLDVFDENAAGISFYDTTRTRRSDEELIRFVRQIPNKSIDAVLLYTLYARSVADPLTKVALLQSSMQYRVLDVKSGRFLGGDNIELNTAGIPFENCAAGIAGSRPDAHCVQQFVIRNIAPLAQDAANKVALQIASLVGSANQPTTTTTAPTPAQPGTAIIQGNNACGNLPTEYVVSFSGIDNRHKNAIEEFMSSWSCALNLEAEDATFSTIKYRYKTRADRVRILRNIRQMSEMMGLLTEPRLDGENKIVVEVVPLRGN